MRSAGIDGRVALTLTSADEAEIREVCAPVGAWLASDVTGV
jgi:hypothetical protein